MQGARHCLRCAAELVLRVPPLDSRIRHVCPACGFVLYLNPKVAAGTVPHLPDGRIALIRRGIEPARGAWSWPCGYVECDETVEQCAVRETREECGLEVELGPLLGIFSYPSDEHEGAVSGTGMVIVCYAATVASGALVAGDDAAAAAWYAPEEVPWTELAFDSSRRGIRGHLARWRSGDEGR